MPILTAPPLVVSSDDVAVLKGMAESRVLAHRVVVQAQALLLAADGVPNEEIARRCSTTPDTVRRWRSRFVEAGVADVGVVRPGRGRKRIVPVEVVDSIVADTLSSLPDDGSTQWSTRTMAERYGVGKDFVAQIWKGRGLKPWLVSTFKLSSDPDFESKLIDIVGLYMNPPERAVVWSFDEKTQCQALNRTQRSLPMIKGRAGTMTHDYKRNGTTDLFAAMNVATGEMLTHTRKTHNHVDFLFFLKLMDLHIDEDLEVHVVLDNLSVHKHEKVVAWLVKHPRFHFHFTPTSSSWLNLVERWFRELTNKRLRRGSFTSVADLTSAIELWVEHWNDDPKPFVWHKPAQEIIAKVKRGRAALTHQINCATDH